MREGLRGLLPACSIAKPCECLLGVRNRSDGPQSNASAVHRLLSGNAFSGVGYEVWPCWGI